MDNDKKKSDLLESNMHLDDIDEFFLKNFNILIDDVTNKTINVPDTREILSLDDVDKKINKVDNDKINENINQPKDVLNFEIEDQKEEVFSFNGWSDSKNVDILDLDDIKEESKDVFDFVIDQSPQETKPDVLDFVIDQSIQETKPDVFDFDIDAYSSLDEIKQIEIDNMEIGNSPLQEDILDEQTREILETKQLPHKQEKSKTKKLILINLLIVIIILLIAVVYKIVRWKLDNDAIKKQVNEVQNSVVLEEVQDNQNTVIVNPTPPSEEINDYYFDFIEMPLMSVNLDELKNKNSDTVGWLKVNGTNINYPVVQTNNNRYYLTRDFNKNHNEAGWIFADYRNNLIDDKNLVIYGHARLDLSMFGTLRYTTKANWYNNSDNHLINLSLDNVNASYQVFSTYIIENESYYIQTYFENNDDYKNFLNTIKSRSVYDYKVPLNENDQILTLSTCHTNDRRVVLHAKLIKKENR